MSPRNRRLASPLRNEPASDPRPERGYALLVVMMAATLLLISLTAALPSAYHIGQRDREEELIFRGNEYARAIALFHRQFRRYPTSVKEMLRTNGIRFLRREYPDPMSRKGKWRFIYANANGVVLNSKTLGPPRRQTPLGSPTPSTTEKAEQESTDERADKSGEEESGSTSSFFSKEIKGVFIVGVASSSRRKSIRVWNGRTRYDEWEFIGLAMNLAGPGVGPGAAPRPPQPGQPGAPPQQQAFPSTSPTTSPFGGKAGPG